MRVAVASLMLVSLLAAGCSDGGGGGGDSASTTTTAAAITTTGPLSTSTGLPVVGVTGDMDVGLALAADGRVHRVRLAAFKDFTLDGASKPGEDDGGGGGGGGGGGNNGGQVKDFGVALFPVDGTPAQQTSCSDAATFPAWDGRTDTTDPEWSVKAGLYDLWAWSSASTTIVLQVNGGGPASNVTMQVHNWTSVASEPAVTKSGPAQSTATFEEVVDSALALLVLGEFTPPQGYPDRTADLAVKLDGTECVKVALSSGGGGGGGGGGGFGAFGSTAIRVHAFVGQGQASLAGNFAASLSPTGEPAAALVVLKPQ